MRRLMIFMLVVGWFVMPHSTQAAGVVGTGTAASCTENALKNVVAGGGAVTFNCGANPVTITLISPLDITAPTTSIDGGGKIALSSSTAKQIITHRTFGFIGSSVLTLSNMTITGARANFHMRPIRL